MHAEKEIVTSWLNKQGFFTITGIAVGKREIDIIAKKGKEIWHVEIVGGVTSVDNIKLSEIKEKFNNKTVVNTILKKIGANYKKVLIIGKTSKIEKYKQLTDIKVFTLSEVLFDTISNIKTHNYKAVSARTSQLIKYLLISEPEYLAKLLDKDNKVLNLQTREVFLKALMEQDETKRVLSKTSFEPELIKIIKNSTLNKPEKLAKALEEKVLNPKTRKKFIETIMQYNEMKKEIKQSIKKSQKTLDFFTK